MSRVLVVDDDPRILAFLRRGLSLEGFDVSTAQNGGEALQKMRGEPPDAVVLDVLMPGLDGFEVCRRLRQVSDVPVLLLTARDAVADRVRGLDLGADDYLVKPFAFEELLARLRALLRRCRPGESEPPPVFTCGDLIVDPVRRYAERAGRSLQLTTKEFDLLLHLVRHAGQVLSRSAIMEAVWGPDFEGESNVLEVYIGYLRQKLEAGELPRLIHTVRGVGYVLRAPCAGT
ncbi:MAG: response regulator transcription factor [Clostridia bacterium]|nr:response regulator transcription factor [Clostridia bacterium]